MLKKAVALLFPPTINYFNRKERAGMGGYCEKSEETSLFQVMLDEMMENQLKKAASCFNPNCQSSIAVMMKCQSCSNSFCSNCLKKCDKCLKGFCSNCLYMAPQGINDDLIQCNQCTTYNL